MKGELPVSTTSMMRLHSEYSKFSRLRNKRSVWRGSRNRYLSPILTTALAMLIDGSSQAGGKFKGIGMIPTTEIRAI